MNTEELSAQAASVAVNYDIHEFVNGQQDCKNGVPHSEGRSESYNIGYSFEYEMAQIISERTSYERN